MTQILFVWIYMHLLYIKEILSSTFRFIMSVSKSIFTYLVEIILLPDKEQVIAKMRNTTVEIPYKKNRYNPYQKPQANKPASCVKYPLKSHCKEY